MKAALVLAWILVALAVAAASAWLLGYLLALCGVWREPEPAEIDEVFGGER